MPIAVLNVLADVDAELYDLPNGKAHAEVASRLRGQPVGAGTVESYSEVADGVDYRLTTGTVAMRGLHALKDKATGKVLVVTPGDFFPGWTP